MPASIWVLNTPTMKSSQSSEALLNAGAALSQPPRMKVLPSKSLAKPLAFRVG